MNTYFKLARGDAQKNIPAMEMTKWFNTNYHYIVPEISASVSPKLFSKKLLSETLEAVALGFNPKPVLVGPITYLSLSKGIDGCDVWSKFDEILAVYVELIGELAPHCGWIQLDEPILCSDLSSEAEEYFPIACQKLNEAAGECKLLLTTYFDELDDNLELALNSGCAGLHLDLVRGGKNLDNILLNFPDEMILSAGLVDGRNIWKTDYSSVLEIAQRLVASLGAERVWLGSSCSLLHCPVDLANEKTLDPQIREWLAFSIQKCGEISELLAILSGFGTDSSGYAQISGLFRNVGVVRWCMILRFRRRLPVLYRRCYGVIAVMLSVNVRKTGCICRSFRPQLSVLFHRRGRFGSNVVLSEKGRLLWRSIMLSSRMRSNM